MPLPFVSGSRVNGERRGLLAEQIPCQHAAARACGLVDCSGNDFHKLGRRLALVADAVRRGQVPSEGALADTLDAYSASAMTACKTVRNFERFIRKQERDRARAKQS